jgi:hypothetical protein
MALPTAQVLAGQIVADLGDSDPRSLDAWEKVCTRILAAMKAATVNPTGLIVPIVGAPGTTPVTGTATIT